MLETVSQGFKNATQRLQGVKTLDDTNITDALRDVRASLLEADVDFQVTKDFLAKVKERALGEKVETRAKDAQGRALRIIPLSTPRQVRPIYAGKDFAAGYVNFLLTDRAVFLPQFGDAEADLAARTALAAELPQRQIVSLDIDAIATGGGGIHCTTQQEPA